MEARKAGKSDAYFAAFKDQPTLITKLKAFEKDVVFAEKFAPALKGEPVPGARGFTGNESLSLIILTDKGLLHPFHRGRFAAFSMDPAKIELVAILGEEKKTLVESKDYSDLKLGRVTISRYQYDMKARLIDASTGKTLAEKNFHTTPRELKISEPSYVVSVGFPVHPGSIIQWVTDATNTTALL